MEIQAISLEDGNVAIPLSNLSGVIAVDYYPLTDSIFWTDVLRNTISTAKIDVSKSLLSTVVLNAQCLNTT